jgi:hypothetical protein
VEEGAGGAGPLGDPHTVLGRGQRRADIDR